MKATNIIINLAVLHIIRVVVLEPRGEEDESLSHMCMRKAF